MPLRNNNASHRHAHEASASLLFSKATFLVKYLRFIAKSYQLLSKKL